MNANCYSKIFSLLLMASPLVVEAMSPSQRAIAQCDCGEKQTCPRDIWMIDTYDVCDCDCDLAKARFLRLDENCQWVTESEEKFLSTLDASKPVNIQLPGYLTDRKYAMEHILRLSGALEAQAKCRGLGCANVRLVMWAWPADKERLRFIPDIRDKAARAHFEGTLVAYLMKKFPSEMRVNFVAYSFGARVATSAAHHLATGTAEAPPSTIRLTAVLIASAVDAQWLEQCQPHSLALQRFEKVLLFTNCKDILLRRYRIVNRNRNSPALGLVGLLMPNGESAAHVTQWEVSGIVGRSHNWYRYIEAPELMPAIAEYAWYLNDQPSK